jgi:accessory gene regulator protein AgrB
MNIFEYIENVSIRIANFIGRGDSEDDIEEYGFSIFLVLSTLLTESAGIAIALIFGYFWYYIICSITFTLLRFRMGGYHCIKFSHCFFTSNILFIIGSVLAILTKNIPEIMWLLSLYCGVLVMPNCPRPSTNSPSRGRTIDSKFQKQYCYTLVLETIISFIFIKLDVLWVSVCISCGILMSVFLVSNIGNKTINYIINMVTAKQK